MRPTFLLGPKYLNIYNIINTSITPAVELSGRSKVTVEKGDFIRDKTILPDTSFWGLAFQANHAI